MGQATLLQWQTPSCGLVRRFSSQTGGESGKEGPRLLGRAVREGGGGRDYEERSGCLAFTRPSLPACHPRLSPEIYLKRPAHSDDWRLDIMLKRKAVRPVASQQAGHDGVCPVWAEVGNGRLQGRETCPSGHLLPLHLPVVAPSHTHTPVRDLSPPAPLHFPGSLGCVHVPCSHYL